MRGNCHTCYATTAKEPFQWSTTLVIVSAFCIRTLNDHFLGLYLTADAFLIYCGTAITFTHLGISIGELAFSKFLQNMKQSRFIRPSVWSSPSYSEAVRCRAHLDSQWSDLCIIIWPSLSGTDIKFICTHLSST